MFFLLLKASLNLPAGDFDRREDESGSCRPVDDDDRDGGSLEKLLLLGAANVADRVGVSTSSS